MIFLISYNKIVYFLIIISIKSINQTNKGNKNFSIKSPNLKYSALYFPLSKFNTFQTCSIISSYKIINFIAWDLFQIDILAFKEIESIIIIISSRPILQKFDLDTDYVFLNVKKRIGSNTFLKIIEMRDDSSQRKYLFS